MEVPSFCFHSVLIILGHRVGVGGERSGKKRDRIFHCPRKYFLQSLRSKKHSCLESSWAVVTVICYSTGRSICARQKVRQGRFYQALPWCTGSTGALCTLTEPALLLKNNLRVLLFLSFFFPHATAYGKPVWHDIQAEYLLSRNGVGSRTPTVQFIGACSDVCYQTLEKFKTVYRKAFHPHRPPPSPPFFFNWRIQAWLWGTDRNFWKSVDLAGS